MSQLIQLNNYFLEILSYILQKNIDNRAKAKLPQLRLEFLNLALMLLVKMINL